MIMIGDERTDILNMSVITNDKFNVVEIRT
jgi:hypothetical protein